MNRVTILIYRFSLALAFLSLIYSCNEDDSKPSPTIISIEPTAAKHSSSVSIKGTNFDPSNVKVSLNGIVASIKSSSGTEVIVTVPKGAKSGNFIIETTGGSCESPSFTYLYSYVVSTFAGSGISGLVDGAAEKAQFKYPTGLAFDKQDNLFVCDRSNGTIRKITPGGQVTTIAGNGTQGSADGIGTSAQFSGPSGIAYAKDGNFYIGEIGGKVRKMTPAGEVTTIAGGAENTDIDGAGAEAGFAGITNLTVNSDGDLIVCDFGNSKIKKVTPLGVVTTLAGNGSWDFAEGQGVNAGVAQAWGIVQLDDNDYYFSSYQGHVIGKITQTNTVTSYAGSGRNILKDGGLGAASFSLPRGLVVIDNHDLIVSDGGNNAVRLISNGMVTTIAGNGTAGFTNGEGGTAQFNEIYGLAVNSKGEIFVCDKGNFVIRKIVRE